jgi:hypothetical protein
MAYHTMGMGTGKACAKLVAMAPAKSLDRICPATDPSTSLRTRATAIRIASEARLRGLVER